jgi:23S rRNA (adenine2030-N6)-methyltransferase
MRIMANQHFGNIGDVWKHVVLAEVLEREPPAWYAEIHAGSGAYAVVHSGGRDYGFVHFLEVAPRFPVLARSRYRAVAASYLEGEPALYPGSALLAMTLLGDTASYLLCDLDRVSVTDLRRWSRELGLRSCEIAEADGMAVVAARLDGDTDRPGLVHIDPFDRHARAPGGYSALELAARVADSGTGLVYWYGYDQHGAQGEAHKQLAALTTAPLWCGEVTVTGANDSLGELDHSATLCTVGIILANVREGTAGACAALGNALSDAYADAVLPDGAPGSLAFTSSTTVERDKQT